MLSWCAMATVTAFLKHSHISKPKQSQPYTAAAHARYIMRKGATSVIYSERMPKQWHAVQRFLNEHEDGLRRNGRILDRFIISIPHDISEPDAVTVLRRFGNRLGQGETPFLFTLQGFDTRNHHAHFIFIDKSVESGKRVYGTTERDSTRGIKLEWETVANSTFEELGYDVRVKVHDGVELANDNEPQQAPLTELEEASEPDSLEEAEDAESGAEDMAETELIKPLSPAGHNVRALHETFTELSRLNNAKAMLAEAERKYELASRERENAHLAASTHLIHTEKAKQNAHQAEELLSAHRTSSGKLKGFGVTLFGYSLKTKGRKEAEHAAERVEKAQFSAKYLQTEQEGYQRTAQMAEAQEQAAEREALLRRNAILSDYGNAEDFAAREAEFNDAIKKRLHDLTVEDATLALADEEITFEEFRTYLEQSGNREVLEAYEEGLKAHRERGYGIED